MLAPVGWKSLRNILVYDCDDEEEKSVMAKNKPEVLVVEPIWNEYDNSDDNEDFSSFTNDYDEINGSNGKDNDIFDKNLCDKTDVKRRIMHTEAIDSVDILIMWAIQNKLDDFNLAALRTIREKAAELLKNVNEYAYFKNKSMHDIKFCKVDI